MKIGHWAACCVLVIAGGFLWWSSAAKGVEAWDTPEYFVALFLLAFVGGLIGVKPWGTGIAIVLLPFLASIWNTITQGWRGPFGPLEQVSFVVIGGLAAGCSFLGSFSRSRSLRRDVFRAVFGKKCLLLTAFLLLPSVILTAV